MNTQMTDSARMIARHARLLGRFSRVADAIRGVVAFMWLPGKYQQFAGPRQIKSKRPVAVTLEVTDNGGLTLAGAITRPRDGKLVYSTIFRYEFTSLMALDARGEVLNVKNDVLARRGLELLTELVAVGERRMYRRASALRDPVHPRFLVPFHPGDEIIDEAKLTELATAEGMQEALVESYRAKRRDELCDSTTIPGTVLVDSAIVPDEVVEIALGRGLGYEDYAPVLGVPHDNPVHKLHEMENPASRVLAEFGVVDLEKLDFETQHKLVAAFRSCCPLGERLTDDEVFDALVNPAAPVNCNIGVDEIDDARVVAAMRTVAKGTRAAAEATSADLLAAARNPGEPLFLRRLSVIQVVTADSLSELPAPYAGWFLPRPDWTPPRRSTSVNYAV